MKIGLSTVINGLNILGVPLLVVYFVCMVVYPFFQGNWAHVHSVWHSWQTVNMGVLALLSSLIAFNISRYRVEEQRKRELIAATSFLSQALSDLSSYLTDCADILSQGRDATKDNKTAEGEFFQGEITPLNSSVKQVFSECIRHGDADLSKHLANILSKVQINSSRIRDLSIKTSQNSNIIISRRTIKYRLFDVAELQALVNAIFHLLEIRKVVLAKIGLKEFTDAYHNLNLDSQMIEEMRDFTRDKLERCITKRFCQILTRWHH